MHLQPIGWRAAAVEAVRCVPSGLIDGVPSGLVLVVQQVRPRHPAGLNQYGLLPMPVSARAVPS